MSKWILNLSTFVDRLSRFLMTVCFGTAFLATIYQVVSRYGFNSSFVLGFFPNSNVLNFPWLEELIRYLFVWGVFLSIGTVYKMKGHARVEIILQALPPKYKQRLNLVSEWINCVLFVILFIKGIELAEISNGQVSSLLGINMAIMYLSIVVCAFICFIHSLAFHTEHLTLKKNAELSKDHEAFSVH